MDENLINRHLKEYSFPNEEEIFSCAFELDNDPDGFDIVCAARQSVDAQVISLEEFWPSALFNCVEDIFSNESFEILGKCTKPVELTKFSVIEHYTICLQSSYLKIMEVLKLYEMFNTQGFKGYLGIDNVGYFAVVCAKSV